MPEITQQNLSSANHEAHLAQVTSNLELQQKLLRKLAKMNNKQSTMKLGAPGVLEGSDVYFKNLLCSTEKLVSYLMARRMAQEGQE